MTAAKLLCCEWQPIETAPRTSKARLLWVPERKSTFCATWRGASDPIDDYYPEGWVIFGGEWCAFLQSASHWINWSKRKQYLSGSVMIIEL